MGLSRLLLSVDVLHYFIDINSAILENILQLYV